MSASPVSRRASDTDLPVSPESSPLEPGMPLDPRARKEAERRELIINGPIHRGVFAIALPSVLTMLLQTTNSLLDTFFVGKLGTEAVAATTVASSIVFALMSAAMAVSVGTTALVARFVGEDDRSFVGEGERSQSVTATTQSLMLGLILSVAVGVPMYFLRVPLLVGLGLHSEALALASRALSYSILGMPTLFTMLILNGAFRGLGDTVRPFWASLAANVVHICFNYLLIFGVWGFPRLGMPGGSIALVISQIVATVIYVRFMLGTPLAPALRGPWRLNTDWVKRIARIGIPASVQQLIRVGSMLMFQGLLARSPAADAAVAALGVGLRSESIAFMPGFGYAIAASAFVGQNLGARKPDRANAGAWSATWQAVGVMSFMGILFATFAHPFASFFIQHVAGETTAQAAQVNTAIDLTTRYLRIALLSEPFLALGMVLSGALQGAGETVSPTAITVGTQLILRLFLGWLLIFQLGYGPVGGWWGMSASTMLAGILTVYIFRQGRWRTTQI